MPDPTDQEKFHRIAYETHIGRLGRYWIVQTNLKVFQLLYWIHYALVGATATKQKHAPNKTKKNMTCDDSVIKIPKQFVKKILWLVSSNPFFYLDRPNQRQSNQLSMIVWMMHFMKNINKKII